MKKAASVGEKKDDDIFFVGIKDPVEIRRSVLESLKGIVEDLQRFERFRAVREEKVNAVRVLKVQVRDLHRMTNKLRTEVPKSDLRVKLGSEHAAIEVEKAKVSKKEKKKATAKKVSADVKEEQKQPEVKLKPKELSELEKLEAELSSIESKLGKIQ
jgi:hypothetical protein